MYQISTQTWSESQDVCPNCGTKKQPIDKPDVGPDTVEVYYRCEECSMEVEVVYVLEDVQVIKQPKLKPTPLSVLCGILAQCAILDEAKIPVLDRIRRKEAWLLFFKNMGVGSMEDLTENMGQRISAPEVQSKHVG